MAITKKEYDKALKIVQTYQKQQLEKDFEVELDEFKNKKKLAKDWYYSLNQADRDKLKTNDDIDIILEYEKQIKN